MYAEQVEINLHQLFHSMAGGLLMATYQPFGGERDDLQPGRRLPLGEEPGGCLTFPGLNHTASFGSSFYQPLTSFHSPGFVTSHNLQLQLSPFRFDIGREASGAPGSLGSFCEANLFSLSPAHSLISK